MELIDAANLLNGSEKVRDGVGEDQHIVLEKKYPGSCGTREGDVEPGDESVGVRGALEKDPDLLRDGIRPIRGGIIDHDNLYPRFSGLEQRIQTAGENLRSVVV